MYIQLLVLFLSLLGLDYFSQQRVLRGWDENRTRMNYIAICCVLLILQSGLRNVAVGADTYGYKLSFVAIGKQSWSDIFENFYRVYVLGMGKDAGYALFVKIFHIFSDNYQVYLLVVASIFFVSFGRFIYYNTTNLRGIYIAMCVYQVLFYSFFSITGIRQTLATAIIFFAYEFVIKRRLVPFLLLCFVAVLIHKSALLFVPFYIFSNNKFPVQALAITLISLPLIFIFIRPIARFLTSFSFSESYLGYANSTYETQGAQMFLVYMMIIAIGVLYFRLKFKWANVNTYYTLNAFCLALFFTPLTWVDPSLMRVVMYYSIFTIFLLGGLVDCFDSDYSNRSDSIATILIVLFIIVLMRKNFDYAFFWEQMELGSNY